MARIHIQDAGEGLRSMQEPAQLIITSPPYYRCRDYRPGHDQYHISAVDSQQLGHEESPFLFARRLAATFGGVSDATFLTPNGSIWIVIGDTIAKKRYIDDAAKFPPIYARERIGINHLLTQEMKWLGWRLFDEVIWQKPNIVPASPARVLRSHEYILAFCRDPAAMMWNGSSVREPSKTPAGEKMSSTRGPQAKSATRMRSFVGTSDGFRARRSVWTINASMSRGSHTATFPREIPRIIIQACSNAGDLVCDPFAGTGTTLLEADALGRRGVGFDIYDHVA